MSEKAPGFEEYTPSRLEWFTTLLNSMLQFITSGDDSISLIYLPENDGKTIVLYVQYPSSMNQEEVELAANEVKKLSINMARSYKWESWLNIEIEYHPTNE